MKISEVFNQPYAFRWDNDSDNDTYKAHTRLPDGTSLEINFYTDPSVDGDEDRDEKFKRYLSIL
jgi:hypothetical protein